MDKLLEILAQKLYQKQVERCNETSRVLLGAQALARQAGEAAEWAHRQGQRLDPGMEDLPIQTDVLRYESAAIAAEVRAEKAFRQYLQTWN